MLTSYQKQINEVYQLLLKIVAFSKFSNLLKAFEAVQFVKYYTPYKLAEDFYMVSPLETISQLVYQFVVCGTFKDLSVHKVFYEYGCEDVNGFPIYQIGIYDIATFSFNNIQYSPDFLIDELYKAEQEYRKKENIWSYTTTNNN